MEEVSQIIEGLETAITDLESTAETLDMSQLTVTYPREQVSENVHICLNVIHFVARFSF